MGGLGALLNRRTASHDVEGGSSDDPMAANRINWVQAWDDVTDSASKVGPVTRARAEGLPGVGHGVELICTLLAQMEPHAVRNLYDPKKPLVVLPTGPLLRDPDPEWHGYSTWMSAVAADMQWHGNAFADKTAAPDSLGYPTRLPLIPADEVTWGPSAKDADRKVYTVRSSTDAPGRELSASEMWHAPVGVRAGKRMGRGIIDRYQDTLRLMVVVERATYVVMRDGKPAGIVSTDTDMTSDELRGVKTALIDGIRRDGIGAMVRAEFRQLSWNARDLALIPAREYNLRLAADCTGLSPYLLGVPSESRVYSNAETEWANAIKMTIQRYAMPVQDAFTDCAPRGQDNRFNTDELSRPDAATRWVNHQIAVNIGAMTIAEVRQAERLGPLPTPPAEEPA